MRDGCADHSLAILLSVSISCTVNIQTCALCVSQVHFLFVPLVEILYQGYEDTFVQHPATDRGPPCPRSTPHYCTVEARVVAL